MKTLIFLAALLLAPLPAPAQTPCPKCGKIHTQAIHSSNAGTFAALDLLNRQRAMRGLYPLQYDAQLQAVAERRARQQASSRARGYHTKPLGHRYAEGIGWTSQANPSSVRACFVTTTSKRRAGCAMVRVPGGGCYFALIVQ